MKISFFGTSLTAVNKWHPNSFVAMVETRLKNSNPNTQIDNFGVGGSNSFRVLQEIENKLVNNVMYDMIFIEMGTNDIFRKFQNRDDEAVDITTFKGNYLKALDIIFSHSKNVVCLLSPSVSDKFEYNINPEIKKYNEEVKKLALLKKYKFIDLYAEFNLHKDENLWSDGLHLGELGCKLVYNKIFDSGVM